MFEVIIKFIDGEELHLTDVTGYHLMSDNSAYVVEKNGYKVYFNYKQIKYIGRSFDLNNCEVG